MRLERDGLQTSSNLTSIFQNYHNLQENSQRTDTPERSKHQTNSEANRKSNARPNHSFNSSLNPISEPTAQSLAATLSGHLTACNSISSQVLLKPSHKSNSDYISGQNPAVLGPNQTSTSCRLMAVSEHPLSLVSPTSPLSPDAPAATGSSRSIIPAMPILGPALPLAASAASISDSGPESFDSLFIDDDDEAEMSSQGFDEGELLLLVDAVSDCGLSPLNLNCPWVLFD